jgi:hypothetical protein
VPAGSQPLVGGTIIARLAGERMAANGVYAAIVRDGKNELARARIDFARMR